MIFLQIDPKFIRATFTGTICLIIPAETSSKEENARLHGFNIRALLGYL